MQRALTALEADKASLQKQLEQMEKDRAADRARQQAEIERLRQEAAARDAAPVELAPTAVPAPPR